MKLFKWVYGILSAAATTTLIVALFSQEVNIVYKIILLAQSVCFAWICGAYSGADT